MANVTIKRTDVKNTDFLGLIKLLDADLAIRDGDEHAFYNQFNALDVLLHAVVAYSDGKPIGCGGIKKYDKNTVEVKRMFTDPSHRGKGLARKFWKRSKPWPWTKGIRVVFWKPVLSNPKQLPCTPKWDIILSPITINIKES